MTRALVFLSVLSAASAAWPQTGDKVQFEVASVKPSPPPDGRGTMVSCSGGPGSKDPTLFTCQNMTLSNLICNAYNIPYYQLVMPESGRERPAMFHVNARVPEGATKEQFQQMLQNLLAERFKLAVHREMRDFQKYELVVARNGPKFKPAAETPAADNGAPRGPMHLDKDGYPAMAPGRPGMAMMNGRARMYQPECTMERLAAVLGAQLRAPVTDATGLTGKYDIGLYWMNGNPAPDSDPGPTLVEAVQQQLGLRLEPRKGPLEFLVVDHAEKTPVEN